MAGERTGVGELLLEEYVGDCGEQECVGAGADGDMPVGEAGGPGAAGVDDGERAAATTQRLEPAGEVGGRAEAAVGFERVGAEEQQMVGAVDVRHRDGVRVAEEQSAGDMFGHLVEGARGEEGPGAERGEQGGRVERAGHGVHVRVAEDDTDGLLPVPLGQCGQGCRDRVERLAPTGLLQHAVLAHEGARSRSGSASSPPKEAPLGQMKPRLKTSSRSPRAPVTRVPSMVRVSPQVASHRGQMRRAVRDSRELLESCGMGPPRGGNSGGAETWASTAEHTDRYAWWGGVVATMLPWRG